jgi:hypothetical protein
MILALGSVRSDQPAIGGNLPLTGSTRVPLAGIDIGQQR